VDLSVRASAIKGLDHVAVVSRRPDVLFGSYERLGFRLTPLSMHQGSIAPGEAPVAWGTGNRCAMMRTGYLELLALVDPTAYCSTFPELIDRYEGLHIVAFGCDDAASAAARLAQAGISTPGVIDLQRELDVAGDRRLARFGLLRLGPGEAPEARVNIIQHHTPQYLWQPDLLDHPNGALALREVAVCVADPDESAARFARILGIAGTPDGAQRRFLLPHGRFVLVGPDDMARMHPDVRIPALPFVASLTIGVADIDATAGLLAANAVAAQRRDGRIVVPPESGCGAICVFERATS